MGYFGSPYSGEGVVLSLLPILLIMDILANEERKKG